MTSLGSPSRPARSVTAATGCKALILLSTSSFTNAFFTVCGHLAACFSLADIRAGDGWERRGPRVQRPDDPRGLSRQGAATGLAGAPRPQGALSRRPAYRPGRADQRADPRGDAGGVAWRWRVRWHRSATNG